MEREKQESMNSNSFGHTANVMLILMPATPLFAGAAGFGFVPDTICRPMEE
jgi:hypothetical protein